MKNVIAVLAFVMVSQAQAQPGPQATQADAGAVQAAPQSATQTASGSATQASPIYIINKVEGSQDAAPYVSAAPAVTAGAAATTTQAAVQEQPVTIVQDTPLRVNPAEQMRKRRQETETATEDGIVQALEKARMTDEIKRRDKFNNAIEPSGGDAPLTQAPPPPSQAVQQPPPQVIVQQIQPAVQPMSQPAAQPVVIPVVAQQQETQEKVRVVEEQDEEITDTKKDEKVDIKQEIRAALSEQKPDEEKQSYYVAGIASFGQYNNVQNVNNSLGYGFSVGTVFPERIVVEGSFIYGDYTLGNIYSASYMGGFYNPYSVDMRQYNVEAAAKYLILPGRFKPMIGAVLSYARRSYSNEGQQFQSSDAVDVGAMVGADLELAKNFALGIDFRYMTNLGYRVNADQGQYVYQQSNTPESLNYYTLNLIAKVMF